MKATPLTKKFLKKSKNLTATEIWSDGLFLKLVLLQNPLTPALSQRATLRTQVWRETGSIGLQTGAKKSSPGVGCYAHIVKQGMLVNFVSVLTIYDKPILSL
jgi:hypothetical protein